MSISDVDIANLALLKLGADSITSFSDANPRARAFQNGYAMLRDKLQRMRWNFNRAYVQIPALADQPPFEYAYIYPLPADYLRLELVSKILSNAPPPPTNPPTILVGPTVQQTGYPGLNFSDYNNSRSQDYRIVGKQIWTWYASPIAVVYGKRVEDPTSSMRHSPKPLPATWPGSCASALPIPT